jgi:hypothetical protein
MDLFNSILKLPSAFMTACSALKKSGVDCPGDKETASIESAASMPALAFPNPCLRVPESDTEFVAPVFLSFLLVVGLTHDNESINKERVKTLKPFLKLIMRNPP